MGRPCRVKVLLWATGMDTVRDVAAVCFANGADNNVHTVFGLPGGTKYDTQPLVCAYCSLPIW